MNPYQLLADIKEAVEHCAELNGDKDVWCRSRERRLVMWRQAAMSIASSKKLSLSAIGRSFGYDHTTIICGIRRHRKEVADGNEFAIGIARQIGAALASMEIEIDESLTNKDPGAAARRLTWSERRRASMERREQRLRWKMEADAAAARKRAAEREAEARRERVLAEMKRLRRLGWSLSGLSRRYDWSQHAIATALGEWSLAEELGERIVSISA